MRGIAKAVLSRRRTRDGEGSHLDLKPSDLIWAVVVGRRVNGMTIACGGAQCRIVLSVPTSVDLFLGTASFSDEIRNYRRLGSAPVRCGSRRRLPIDGANSVAATRVDAAAGHRSVDAGIWMKVRKIRQ